MWNVFQGTYDGRPLLVRGNIGAKNLAGSKALPIKVAWRCPSRTRALMDSRSLPRTPN